MVWKPHTTVAANIERGNKFLMVEELVFGEQVINQPAAHLDPDESLVEARWSLIVSTSISPTSTSPLSSWFTSQDD